MLIDRLAGQEYAINPGFYDSRRSPNYLGSCLSQVLFGRHTVHCSDSRIDADVMEAFVINGQANFRAVQGLEQPSGKLERGSRRGPIRTLSSGSHRSLAMASMVSGVTQGSLE